MLAGVLHIFHLSSKLRYGSNLTHNGLKIKLVAYRILSVK